MLFRSELDDDAAALDAVLGRFAGGAEAAQIGSDAPEMDRSEQINPTLAENPAPMQRRWRPTTTVALVLSALGGVLLGAVAGLSFTGALNQQSIEFSAAEKLFAAFDGSTSSETSASGSSVLQVFDGPTGLPGGEVLNLGQGYINESIRNVFGTVREPGGYGVYAVQRETDDYCLVIIDGQQELNSACAPLSALQKNGLWLLSRIVAKFPNGDDPHSPQFVDVIVRWAPDGSFSQHAVPAH